MSSENIITMNREQHDVTNLSVRDVNARIIRECKKVLDQDLTALVKKMFDNVDDFLFDLAEKCETNQKQALYFDAMRVIRLRREKIEKSYHHHMDASFNQALSLPMSETRQSDLTTGVLSDELSLDLIDQEELEESLAITNMVSKLSSHLNRDLYALAQRFNAIFRSGLIAAVGYIVVVVMFRFPVESVEFLDLLPMVGTELKNKFESIVIRILDDRKVVKDLAESIDDHDLQ